MVCPGYPRRMFRCIRRLFFMSLDRRTESCILCIGIRGIRLNFRGALPTLILQALIHEARHGYSIAQQIKARSKGLLDFKEGTLYPALHKLENQGLVESYEEVQRGRTRRYYRITRSGRTALVRDRAEWRDLSQAVSMILEEV